MWASKSARPGANEAGTQIDQLGVRATTRASVRRRGRGPKDYRRPTLLLPPLHNELDDKPVPPSPLRDLIVRTLPQREAAQRKGAARCGVCGVTLPREYGLTPCEWHRCPYCTAYEDEGCDDCTALRDAMYAIDWPETITDPRCAAHATAWVPDEPWRPRDCLLCRWAVRVARLWGWEEPTGHQGEDGCIHCTVCDACQGSGRVCQHCELCLDCAPKDDIHEYPHLGTECEYSRWVKTVQQERTFYVHSVFDRYTGVWL